MPRIVLKSAGLCLTLLACTFTSPPSVPTPTAPAVDEPAVTSTLTPEATATETLRPTVTNLPTFTPVGEGLPTTIPLNENNSTGSGGFGFGSVGGSASVPGNTDNNEGNTQQGVAPVGVRDVTAAPSNGGTGSGSVGVGSRGSGSVVSVTSTPVTSTGSGSVSVEVVLDTPSPLTPTVPPSINQRYSYAVAAGNQLVVNYDITLLRGIVIIWVVAPNGQVIWQQGFTETINSETEIEAPETGEYDIFAYVDDFSGNFQVGFGSR
ncbi:MAG: hypothetical protein AAFV33_16510 [Chloroflexota bacterium]